MTSHLRYLIDQIWINDFAIYTGGIVSIDITDHLPTFIDVRLSSPISTEISTEKSGRNLERFKERVAGVNWPRLLVGDVDAMTATFERTINDIYCRSFPLRVKYVSSKRLEKPQLTSGILKSIKTKALYFKLSKLGLIAERENKVYKNRLTNIIRSAKKHFLKGRFENCKQNLGETWRNIRRVIGKNDHISQKIKFLSEEDGNITDCSSIASVFNDYFTSVPLSLSSAIMNVNIDPISYLGPRIQSSFFIDPVSSEEVSLIFGRLRNTGSGLDVLSRKRVLSHSR